MKRYRFGIGLLALWFSSAAFAQNNLPRSDVGAIKDKLEAVRDAMGVPAGYVKESEDFNLPTEFNPTQKAGKFWPITSSVSLTYTDAGVQEAAASAEQASQDFEARYAAALASGDVAAISRLSQEMLRISSLSAAAAFSGQSHENIDADVQFNLGPYAAIDPDAVAFESKGVIALRDLPDGDRLVVYLDPVNLAETETLSSFRLGTPDDGVADRDGVFNIMITLNGAGENIEAWAHGFDTDAMLAVIDAQ